jgi:hypothetical protein
MARKLILFNPKREVAVASPVYASPTGSQYMQTGVALNDGDFEVFVHLYEDISSLTPYKEFKLRPQNPKDWIYSWRASYLLSLLPQFDLEDMADAYTIASRAFKIFDERYPVEFVHKLTTSNFARAMAVEVRTEVVNLIVFLARTVPGFNPDTITDEIERKHIQWREEFHSVGILKPEEREGRDKVIETALQRYQVLVEAYKHRFKVWLLPPDLLQEYIVAAIEKGLEQKYGTPLTCVIAITLTQQDLLERQNLAHDEILVRMEKILEQNALWLEGMEVRNSFAFSPDKAKELIRKMLNEWGKIPKTYPIR